MNFLALLTFAKHLAVTPRNMFSLWCALRMELKPPVLCLEASRPSSMLQNRDSLSLRKVQADYPWADILLSSINSITSNGDFVSARPEVLWSHFQARIKSAHACRKVINENSNQFDAATTKGPCNKERWDLRWKECLEDTVLSIHLYHPCTTFLQHISPSRIIEESFINFILLHLWAFSYGGLPNSPPHKSHNII